MPSPRPIDHWLNSSIHLIVRPPDYILLCVRGRRAAVNPPFPFILPPRKDATSRDAYILLGTFHRRGLFAKTDHPRKSNNNAHPHTIMTAKLLVLPLRSSRRSSIGRCSHRVRPRPLARQKTSTPTQNLWYIPHHNTCEISFPPRGADIVSQRVNKHNQTSVRSGLTQSRSHHAPTIYRTKNLPR